MRVKLGPRLQYRTAWWCRRLARGTRFSHCSLGVRGGATELDRLESWWHLCARSGEATSAGAPGDHHRNAVRRLGRSGQCRPDPSPGRGKRPRSPSHWPVASALHWLHPRPGSIATPMASSRGRRAYRRALAEPQRTSRWTEAASGWAGIQPCSLSSLTGSASPKGVGRDMRSARACEFGLECGGRASGLPSGCHASQPIPAIAHAANPGG